MGKLYWKFFAFFFLAQVATVLIVTVAIGMRQPLTPPSSQPLPNHFSLDHQIPPNGFAPPPDLPRPPNANRRELLPLIPLIVGFFVSFIFAALLANYFSKPIKQLRQAFEQAASGDLQVRISDAMQGRRDELADLGQAFDVMVSRISQVLQSQTTLLHQVSHELRSPLSRLQMAIGLLKQQPDKLDTSLERIERESVRMDSLVGELLTLSRLESGVTRLQKEPVNLNDLLTALISDASFEAQAKNVSIQFLHQSTIPIVVQGQQDLLHRAIENVLRNAIKYSPFDSQIIVELTHESLSNSATVRICDKGAGVSAADLAHIFTPFYRAEGQANQSKQGYGLGLAIAKQVIESHGGNIAAKTPAGGGFELLMLLPIEA
jgi:two-component system, OmpR family, sensor kinase